jgi:DNA polymerase-3 subunit epsilon
LAAEHGLCWKLLGIEKRSGPCFARQIHKCRGACVGEESAPAHALRVATALAPYRIKPWPFAGAIGVREQHPETGRTRVEVFDLWRHLGAAGDDAELAEILQASRPTRFDFDVYRILDRHLKAPAHFRRVLQFARMAVACEP